MKERVIVFTMMMLMVFSGLVYSEKLGVLDEMYLPLMMEVAHGKVYCVQDTTVFMYDLKTLKLEKKFCKKGEGPGEQKINPGITNFLVPLKKSIMFVGIDKAIFYTPDGTMEREVRIPQMSGNYLYPLGKDSYLGLKFKMDESNGTANLVSGIYNDKFEMEPELYTQKFTGGQNLINLTADGINLAVEDDKIFIEQSARGFQIAMYDFNGKLLKTIKREVPKEKFSKAHEDNAMTQLRNNPVLKGIGWENFKQMVKIIHDDYLPPIKDMVVNGGQIYLMTNRMKDGNVEFLVMDQEGKVLKEVFLPQPTATDFISVIFGRPTRYYKIYDGKYYYLKENAEEESWELYVKPI